MCVAIGVVIGDVLGRAYGSNMGGGDIGIAVCVFIGTLGALAALEDVP